MKSYGRGVNSIFSSIVVWLSIRNVFCTARLLFWMVFISVEMRRKRRRQVDSVSLRDGALVSGVESREFYDVSDGERGFRLQIINFQAERMNH